MIERGFLGSSVVKNPPAMQEPQGTWVPSLGQEGSLGEGMATHSSVLAWRIPWTEESGRLQFTELQSQTRLKRLSSSMHTKSFQSCLTLCEYMDCSLPGSSVYGDSPSKNTGVGCYALLQGRFPIQGLNPCLLWLLHCRRILYR